MEEPVESLHLLDARGSPAWWLVVSGDSAVLCCGWEPGLGQGSVPGRGHTCGAQAGGASEMLFALAQEDRCVFVFCAIFRMAFVLLVKRFRR